MFESFTTISGTSLLDVHNEIEIPITAPKMTYQTIYFNPPIRYNFNKIGDMSIKFLDFNNHILRFNQIYEPLIIFSFQ